MKEKINWKKIEKIFFVGIKGVGMTPLALISDEAGFKIEGSDIDEEFITDEVLNEKKIMVHVGFDKSVISEFFAKCLPDSSLVITTGAHSGYDNPQVLMAKELKIPILNQGQALGIFMSGLPFGRKLKGITVTGSHGKTTVSAMLSTALVNLNLDPSYAVGTSKIFPIGNSGHYGKGEIFVSEGDEYVGEPVYDRTPKILYHTPHISIINNIDFDHPDVYENIDDVLKTILNFINKMKKNGIVFINSDDDKLREIKNKIREDLKVITYGRGDADYEISDIKTNLGNTKFKVNKGKNSLGEFTLNIPGTHNAHNSIAVIAVLDSMGVSADNIKKAVFKYRGCKRRMEFIGETKEGAIIVDDYGHHPAEITSTLSAIKKFYGKQIICVFQSHTYSRTKKFLDAFSKSFDDVMELILIPIFRSQRDTESDIISNEDFAAPFMKNSKNVSMLNNLDVAVSYLKNKKLNKDSMIVTIGAGDVYKIGYKLVK